MPPPRSRTICNKLGFVFGGVLTIFVLLAAVVYPNLSKNNNVSVVVEETWAFEDLSSMAGSSTMAAAVSFLTNAAHESGSAKLELDEITALIDTRTAADIRTAIFMVSSDGRATNKFDKFARTTNAEATCSTAGTAGALGLDVCLAGCEKKTSFLAWTPQKGACYMLCALATSPCTKGVAGTTQVRPVSWGTKATDWRDLPVSWIMLVLNWATRKAPAMMSVVVWMAIKLEVVVMWMALQMVAVVIWMALQMEAAMTWEIAWTAMKVVLLLSLVYRLYIKNRARMARGRETEKGLKARRRELDELKLDLMFQTREALLNEEGLHPLHDLGALVIDRDSVNGGQPLAPEGQLPAARGARPSPAGRRRRSVVQGEGGRGVL